MQAHRAVPGVIPVLLLQLALPVAAWAAIEGYVAPLSGAPADTLDFRMSSSADYQVTFARYSRQGDQSVAIPLTTPVTMPAGVQATPPSAWEGCGWSTSFRFGIPPDWPSGIYAAECASTGASTFRIPFVVTPRPDAHRDFAMLVNTNTWNAYNNWGGRSKYSNPTAHYLSFLRPNPMAAPMGSGLNHLTRAELWVHDWLATSGYRVDVYSDLDFHRGIPDLDRYKALILNTHPEYWTREMFDHLETYLGLGGCVLYVGGNGLYEEVVFSADGNTLTMYPENFCGDNTCRRRSYFRNLSPPRPERAVLGVAYRSDGFMTFAPFQVLAAGHRFFAGTGLVNGDSIGVAGLNGAASGWEMDTSIPGLAPDGVLVSAYGSDDRGSPPANIELLARGTNSGGYGADMTWYATPSGGGVFSAGSLSFGGSLVVDATLQRIVRNVLDEFVQRPVAGVASGGGGNAVDMLGPNAPNPFVRSTRIRFVLTRPDRVRLRIYDVSGRMIRTLMDGIELPRQDGSVSWDGLDDSGRNVAGGVYVVRLESSERAESRRIVRLP
jgi:hypothetical protein